MNRLLILAFVASALTGCNSDQVGIQQISPSQTPSQNAPGVQGSTQKDSSPSQNGGAQTIYFNQIRLEDGTAPLINGVGFLASNSDTEEPFVFGLSTMLPLGSQFMTPNSSGLTLLTSSNKQSEVDLVDATTLQHQKIDGLNNVLAFVSDANGNISAWVSVSGEAFLKNTTNAFSKIDLGGQKAISVTPGGPFFDLFLTGGPTPTVIAVNIKTATVANTFQAAQVFTSPDGTQSLLLSPGKPAQVYDWTTRQTSSLSTKDEVNEPSWKNESLFVYWTQTDSGLTLKTFDLLTQTDQVVTELNLSDETSGIVCPIWVGDSLYYGDEEGLSFAIERADADTALSGTWKTVDFATSAESRFGFVCPQSSTLNGASK